MKGMLIPVDGEPSEIDIEPDSGGSTLHALQGLVGGNIEPFDVIFGDGISVYVNDEGVYTCPPNRAVYATASMEEAGYVSQMDYSHAVREGELYSILFGDLVAVGFNPETGDDRDLTVAEADKVRGYFTDVSPRGSGMKEVIAIQLGQNREPDRQREEHVTLKGEAEAARKAAEALADGHADDAPMRGADEKDLG